jgi:DNA-binding beta-propeller fold protein YncE
MPHSSRLSPGGDRQYSVMMMTDELVETDAFRFEVNRRLSLLDQASFLGASSEDSEKSTMPMAGSMNATVRPTWVQPDPGGRFVYVACNGTDEVKEVDLERWEVTRTFSTPAGPYNIDVTPDGRLMVVTYKADGSTGVWDLSEGRQLARLVNSRGVTHGIVTSPDSRFAFVSAEGRAGEPGALDVIDLEALEIVASIDIGPQASGIAFWKMD